MGQIVLKDCAETIYSLMNCGLFIEWLWWDRDHNTVFYLLSCP